MQTQTSTKNTKLYDTMSLKSEPKALPATVDNNLDTASDAEVGFTDDELRTRSDKNAYASYKKALTSGEKARDHYFSFGELLFGIYKSCGNLEKTKLSNFLKENYPKVTSVDRRIRAASVYIFENKEAILSFLDDDKHRNLVLPTSIRNKYMASIKPKKVKQPNQFNADSVRKAVEGFLPKGIDEAELDEYQAALSMVVEALAKLNNSTPAMKAAA